MIKEVEVIEKVYVLKKEICSVFVYASQLGNECVLRDLDKSFPACKAMEGD